MNDPHTPDKYANCSKRSFDGQLRKWRRQLHAYDPIGHTSDVLQSATMTSDQQVLDDYTSSDVEMK